MTLPNDKWEEIPGRPGYYQRIGPYTPEQIEMLKRRPTQLIESALGRRRGSIPSQPQEHK